MNLRQKMINFATAQIDIWSAAHTESFSATIYDRFTAEYSYGMYREYETIVDIIDYYGKLESGIRLINIIIEKINDRTTTVKAWGTRSATNKGRLYAHKEFIQEVEKLIV